MADHFCGKRDAAKYGKGEGLVACAPINLREIKNFDQMLRAMSQTSFQGRKTGEAADVLEAMVRDDKCFKVLTLAGAMTVAQMGLVICDFIDCFSFDCVASTGALMLHGLNQNIGGKQYKVPQGVSDRVIYHSGYNRVYDTLELEENMDRGEEFLREVLNNTDPEKIWSSWEICAILGKHLSETMPVNDRSPFKSAFQRNIPIFIPALSDSEIGLDAGIRRYDQALKGKPIFGYNPFIDWEKYVRMVESAIKQEKKLAIFTIGGGVPRNWAQQVGPYFDIRGVRLGEEHGAFARFYYGVRISTALEQDGGFSGSTYKERVNPGEKLFHRKKEE